MVIATLYGWRKWKTCIFSGSTLDEFSLHLIWGHLRSKILFALEVFHVTDSPCLLELLPLQTLLTCKWLILLFVILVTLANINRWLSFLTKNVWESPGTQSCLYVISYLSTLCGGAQEEKEVNTCPSQTHVILCPTEKCEWISIICLTVSMVIF